MMNKSYLLLASLLIAGCISKDKSVGPGVHIIDRGEYKVDTRFSSQAQNERVRFLVFHYTACDDAESLRLLTQGGVSAHYLVPQHPAFNAGKPVVLQLVAENKRAWHAGVSQWNGRENINDTSIGIEIVNPGFTHRLAGKQWYHYGEDQLLLIGRLAKDIIERYNISPDNVIGHADIAGLRKTDPGPLFPWQRLAQLGIGAWPDDETVAEYLKGTQREASVPVLDLQHALARYGYAIAPTGELDPESKKIIAAFQMHFRQDNFSGNPDAETLAIARALVAKYRS